MLDKFILTVARPFIFLVHPYKVTGREHIPASGGAVLCGNHLSNWDPVLLLLCQRRRICFMAKEELFHNRLLGRILSRTFGAFPVARGKGDTTAIDTAQKIVQNGDLMGIYPEGTRSRDGRMLRFKSGAALITAKTGADVIPCGIDRRTRPFRVVHIAFGAPISAEELHLTGDHPDLRYATRLLMERVRELSGQELAQ